MTEQYTPMTDEELRKIAENATPGEWESTNGSHILESRGASVAQVWGVNWRNNQRFIATFNPEMVLDLLDRVETLHTRNLTLQRQADTAEHDRQLAWRDMDRSRTEKAEAVKEVARRTARLEHFESEYNRLETVVENMDRALQRVRELYPGADDPCAPKTCTHTDCEIINALEGDE